MVRAVTRNDWLSELALGLASLTILPETAVAQARLSALLRVRDAVWRAWFANDQATLSMILPKEVIAINHGQPNWEHRAEILESAKQFATDGGKLIRLSFPHVETQFLGDVAILYSTWQTETEVRGERAIKSGRATEIFIHRDGQWLTGGWHLDSGQ